MKSEPEVRAMLTKARKRLEVGDVGSGKNDAVWTEANVLRDVLGWRALPTFTDPCLVDQPDARDDSRPNDQRE
ncbi:MAG: hypothetical protein AAB420_02165 [Patescibacteria group bacterium]